MQQSERVAIHNPAHLAFLIRGMERRNLRDTETLSSDVRVLNNPRGAARTDAERFTAFVRALVKQELEKEPRC